MLTTNILFWKNNISSHKKVKIEPEQAKSNNDKVIKQEKFSEEIFRCRCCRGVMKCCCTSCALLYMEGWSYLASRCRYVDISVHVRIPRPSSSSLDEYHIPRVVSLVTSENLILWRFSANWFSDKNLFYSFQNVSWSSWPTLPGKFH